MAPRTLIALLILLPALAMAQQSNSGAASLLIDGGSGSVNTPVRTMVSVTISGAPNSRLLLLLGTALNPGIPTQAGELGVSNFTIVLDGGLNPSINTGPSGTVTYSFELPAISPVGLVVTAQAVVEDTNSSIGLTLSAPTTITTTASSVSPDFLFFIPIVGAAGTLSVIPPAGTMPGDMPEMDRYGDIGPTQVFHPTSFLPVPTPFASPFPCKFCHGGPPEVWDAYMGTMMANSMRDPIFLGAFAIACADAELLKANNLSPVGKEAVADICLRCHTPPGWQGGRSGAKGNGTTTHFEPDIFDHNLGLDQEGIVCEVCHRATGYTPTIAPGFSLDPNRPENGQLVFTHDITRNGPFPGSVTTTYPGTNAYGALLPGAIQSTAPPVPHTAPNYMGTAISPMHETEQNPFTTDSAMCGSCHNVTNPLTGIAEQRTYTEWVSSDFADPNAAEFSTCQDCHMPKSPGLNPSCNLMGWDPTYGFFNKSRLDLPSHQFAGANAWVPQLFKILYPNVDQVWKSTANYTGFIYSGSASRDVLWDDVSNAVVSTLATAAEVNLTASETTPGTIDAVVSIENKTGHKLPTGYPEGRRMWIQVRAFDANGVPFFETGMLDSNSELILDANIKVYEMHMGSENAVLGIPYQDTFHFLLNNMITKDNRIHPKGMVQKKGMGGTDSFDPVLAPWPLGGLYPDNHYIDTTNYQITVPAGTARPIRVAATVLHQVSSFEYVDFLANGGDAINSTQPSPGMAMVRNLWLSGTPAPALSVGFVGPSSTPDPSSPNATSMVILP